MNSYLKLLLQYSNNNKYFIIYSKIIEKNICSNEKSYYTEKHHILPSSICDDFQKKDPNNIVRLTAREHFICHRLLTKFALEPLLEKMIYAVFCFTRKSKTQKRITINSRTYEYIKSQRSLLLKGKSPPNKGKPMSENQKDKLRKPKPKDQILKMSKTKQMKKEMGIINSWTQTEEGKKILSQRMFENNPFKGKTHSDEAKLKISQSKLGKPAPIRSDTHKKSLSDSLKGRSQKELYGDQYDKIIEKRREKLIGKTHSEETKLKMSQSKLGKKKPASVCPHCGLYTANKRWHFDNCKFKENISHS